MLPMEFDHQALSSLPPVDEVRITGLTRLLDGMISRRVLPYFRLKGSADSVALARASEHCAIARLEDLAGRIRCVSILSHGPHGWTIHIHERVFDYIAFGIPWDLVGDLQKLAPEGRKALAFAELLLRHELEHMLRPQAEEKAVILADAEFAMDRREMEPDYYTTLRDSLSDELGGLKGAQYLRLFDAFERGETTDELVAQILRDHAERLAEVPVELLRGAFPTLDRDSRSRLIDRAYRNSRMTYYPLVQRGEFLRKVFALFTAQLELDRSELEMLYITFTKRWGVEALLQEMEVNPHDIEGQRPEALIELFVSRLRQMAVDELIRTTEAGPEPSRRIGDLEPHEALQDSPRMSLNERVEAARKNPLVPRSVLNVIDKNRTGLQGHSAAKYTELVETLLAVPWGRIHRVEVGPREFAEGLNASHYGLDGPKDIISDFFSNLIWRYRNFAENKVTTWQRSGSSFLFVGPPGVGKTSLAISIARNLGIPYHKISLGGMRDESDLRGHGFTYEGSKPGAIVQGLIKMGVMNGMFIMDEADKTEKFAIATLLEILDPEQNHLFHDKYTQTTVDIDLSNSHFILTANTLETVPAPVIDRCQVVVLNRYSVEEKVAIARRHIIPRIRKQHGLDDKAISFDPEHEEAYLRELITNHTYEAGVRQLEWTLRTLFLRIQRREIFERREERVVITHQLIKQYLEEPLLPRRVNEEDRVGEIVALGVDVERGVGNIIPIQATGIRGGFDGDGGPAGAVSMVHATGNIEKVMDESRKVAVTGILHCAEELGIDPKKLSEPVHLHFMGGSTRKDGPSAGGAIGIALASLWSGRKVRCDVAMTGEIDTHGRITAVGGLDVKLETAANAGCKTVIIARENLHGPGGIERFPEPLKRELQILTFEEWERSQDGFDFNRHVLQVVAVDHITQAERVAVIDEEELSALEERFVAHARTVADELVRDVARPSRCPMVVLVKDPDELENAHFQARVCARCTGCRLLVPKEARQDLQTRLAGGDSRIDVIEYDPAEGDLRPVLVRTLASFPTTVATSQLVVVAPYFALKAAAFSDPENPRIGDTEVRLFANNYAKQGVKLKRCKAVLNRTICRISHASPRVVQTTPFLAFQDGVTMVDLSPIPAKYRLHIPRAEDILNRCLAAWLHTVEKAFESPERVAQDHPSPVPG